MDKDQTWAFGLQPPDELIDITLAGADGATRDHCSVVFCGDRSDSNGLCVDLQSDGKRARLVHGWPPSSCVCFGSRVCTEITQRWERGMEASSNKGYAGGGQPHNPLEQTAHSMVPTRSMPLRTLLDVPCRMPHLM
jgi:hypothetical protein